MALDRRAAADVRLYVEDGAGVVWSASTTRLLGGDATPLPSALRGRRQTAQHVCAQFLHCCGGLGLNQ